MNTPLEVLTTGRELLADPKNWTKGWFARTKDGSTTHPDDPKAVCFCSIGAVGKTTPGQIKLRRDVINLLDQVTGGIVQFNDNSTHAEVLAVWDKAIELAHHQ
jgi:hypothetical protein